MEVTYYAITKWGRARLNAKTDEGAIAEATNGYFNQGGSNLVRIMKETKEIVWLAAQ